MGSCSDGRCHGNVIPTVSISMYFGLTEVVKLINHTTYTKDADFITFWPILVLVEGSRIQLFPYGALMVKEGNLTYFDDVKNIAGCTRESQSSSIL